MTNSFQSMPVRGPLSSKFAPQSAGLYNREGSAALVAGVALWPLIQLGISFYISVATVAALCVILAFGRTMTSAVPQASMYVASVAPLMLLCLLAAPASLQDILRVVREIVFYSLLILAFLSSRRVSYNYITTALMVSLALIAAGEFFFAFVQSMAIPRNVFITFPRGWFVQNSSTLPDLIDLIYSRIRPSGTFGEPSYLGFIGLSIALAVSPLLRHSRLALLAFLCAIGAGLMSQSASFVVAAFLVLPMSLLMTGVIRPTARSMAVALFAAVIVAAIASPFLTFRLSEAISGGDSSINTRLVVPAMISWDYLEMRPFGAPISMVNQTIGALIPGLGAPNDAPVHNALFNLIFSYGLGGIFVICSLLIAAPSNTIRLYVIAAANFNGTLLQTDKFAVISATVIVFTAALSAQRLGSHPRWK